MKSAQMLACAFALVAGTASIIANAAQRTFVASTGSDGNNCSLGAPCRSFATAIAHTDANGEIIVLDSAGYGPVAISQSVSIIAPTGVYAGVSVFSGDGVTIDGAQIDVTLRGLSINGQGLPTTGISFLQGNSLRIEHCVVSNMSSKGLLANASGSKLFVADSVFRDNGSAGVQIQAGEAAIEGVRSLSNFFDGFRVEPNSASAVYVSIRDSIAASNGATGFVVFTDAGETARLAVENSSAFRNGTSGPFSGFSGSGSGTSTLIVTRSAAIENSSHGISAFGQSTTVIVSDSTFSRNEGAGMWQSAPAVFRSLQNNAVEENTGGATSGTITNATLR